MSDAYVNSNHTKRPSHELFTLTFPVSEMALLSRSVAKLQCILSPVKFNWDHAAYISMRRRKKQKKEDDPCPNKTCEEKKTLWSFFRKTKPKKTEKSPFTSCRKREALRKNQPDPDFSQFNGDVYRTCGSAYIIQQDKVKLDCVAPTKGDSPDDKLVDRLEAHPDIKDVVDPLPDFVSVEQRLLDLCEKKLHPLYKKYMFMPKKKSQIEITKFSYKSRSGCIKPDEIPEQLNINKELFEKKNLFADFKTVEPPRQLVSKLAEIKLNARPTLEESVKRTSKNNKNQTK
ncbi:unnamed protein product [Acanthoscelides obtectus]|uniref:Uncharacterized protein n=1 Tax=Acanthoscelides obtectus TaxID=200917 RepID=A0A9P0P713_ACAOB|nr:unnamed protein product [Acanthoscelides obtectus]CAK1651762.1 hypothetical protein AOBTE_LOCUS17439 [Acanthoscelides obtectus]